jgi:predicted alpha/beta-hydrolase family hydrolase
MYRFARLSLLSVLLSFVAHGASDGAAAGGESSVRHVTTPRGEVIEVASAVPAGDGPFPAVIIGSGQGYDMRQPLMKQLTAKLLQRDIAVYRFNWAFWLKTRKPGGQSADRLSEIEDYTTVVDVVRADARVDNQRLILAGKSLGSIIAWHVFRGTPQARAAVLLTPVCSKPGSQPVTPHSNYPQFANEQRPSVWIVGDADPLCSTDVITPFAFSANGRSRVVIVAGGHAFEQGKPSDAEYAQRLTANIDKATDAAVDFIATALQPVTVAGNTATTAISIARPTNVFEP